MTRCSGPGSATRSSRTRNWSPPTGSGGFTTATTRSTLVGAGTAGYYATGSSQQAIETYRPIFGARVALLRRLGIDPVLHTLAEAIARSSILVGSPQQIIDKVHWYHERLGHEVMHLTADGDGLTDKQHWESLELFQNEIAPVLRREIPSRPFPPASEGPP